jgi:acetyl-CoA acyltransferase
MKQAVIVAGARTAIGKASRGKLKNTRPDDMAALVLKDLLRRVPNVDPVEIDDVVIGTSFPEAEQGTNIGRQVALLAGLSSAVPGFTVNRFCASGLQSIAIGAQNIMCNLADIVIAGGVESMSMLPFGSAKTVMNPKLISTGTYLSMGETAENVAARYGVTREEQDQFALRSHQLAISAIDSGKMREQIVPVHVTEVTESEDGGMQEREVIFAEDEGIRRGTSIEALGQLKPAFLEGGSVTAGNSSQTSDAAAMTMIMSDTKAVELGLKPIAVFRAFAVAGVEPDVMGIGPVAAIPKVLKLAGLSLADIDLIELNEAFASQAVYVIRKLGLDLEKTNVNGGAIALGHPLGCTGTRMTVDLLQELKHRKGKYGLVTMCIAGGMGAAAVFEMM